MRRRRKFIALLTVAAIVACRQDRPSEPAGRTAAQENRVVEGRRSLMGTDFRISVAGTTEGAARSAIAAALQAVEAAENRLHPKREASDIYRINEAAGVAPVPVATETIALFALAGEISHASGGAFDITYAALSPVWRALRDKPPRLPLPAAVDEARQLVNYRELVIDTNRGTAYLPRRGMRVNVGGIGKGQAVDEAAAVLTSRGIENFIVGGGGDLLVRGTKNGRPWRLGVQAPRANALIGELSLRGRLAVVTSGDYERFVEIDGRRYHHILDARTGRPADASVAVTLVAPTAAEADALATAVFVMGPEAGMALVRRRPSVEALIIAPDMTITISPGMEEIVRLYEGATTTK